MTRRSFPKLRKCCLLVLTLLALLGSILAGSHSGPRTSLKRTLKVMTYNIHVGVGMDKKLDLQRIADVISKEQPDLVGLQEVDRGVKRTEGKDEIAESREDDPNGLCVRS